MFAEDNSVNQLLFRKMLMCLGCDVYVAIDVRKALEVLRAETIDVVLMDCQMPELGGYEATREIRSMEKDRQRFFAAGMNDFLSKPLILSNLEAALSRWAVPTVERDPQSYPR